MPRLSTLYHIDYTLKNGYNSIEFMSTIKLTNPIDFTHAKLNSHVRSYPRYVMCLHLDLFELIMFANYGSNPYSFSLFHFRLVNKLLMVEIT